MCGLPDSGNLRQNMMTSGSNAGSDLPCGWRHGHDAYGRIIFIDPSGRASNINPWWHLYETGDHIAELGPLPNGWELRWRNEGRPFFYHGPSSRGFFVDPRRLRKYANSQSDGLDSPGPSSTERIADATNWQHPYHVAIVEQVVGTLPEGWSVEVGENDELLFIDHRNRTVQRMHPEESRTVYLGALMHINNMISCVDANGARYFCHGPSGTTQWLLPGECERLASMLGPFPDGIEVRMAPDFRYLMIDNINQTKFWPASPLYMTAHASIVKPDDGLGPLPTGWLMIERADGSMMFIDKNTESYLECDPRHRPEPPRYASYNLALPDGAPPEADMNLTEGFENLGLLNADGAHAPIIASRHGMEHSTVAESINEKTGLEDEPSDTEDKSSEHIRDNVEFQYSALAAGEIRILVIHPARNADDPIRCSLQHISLAAPGEYEALSYAWGDRKNMKPLIVDGKGFKLRENAEAALQRLRSSDQDRRIWIDAICINQNDDGEKALQLPMMTQIYEKARRVCIWLGEMTEGAMLAIDRLKHTNQTFRSTMHLWRTGRKHGKLMLPMRSMFDSLQDASNRVTEFQNGEIRELMSRPWWGRGWIVQEVIVGRRPVFLVGDEVFDWADLAQWKKRSRQTFAGSEVASPFGLDTPPEHEIFDQFYQTLSAFRERWQERNWEMPILDLLYQFRHLGFANKRDRIYAFLGITSLPNELNFKPNYSHSTKQVYRGFALTLINHSGSLDVLNYKREWKDVQNPVKPVCAFSMLDQAKYHDTYANIVDSAGAKPRKAWARLPDSWERREKDKKAYYYNWVEGKEYPSSPFQGQPPSPAQHIGEQKICPPGWNKKWDNQGRHRVFYGLQEPTESVETPVLQKFKLPTWVPNWSKPTHMDPLPLLDGGKEPRFYAGGKDRIRTGNTQNEDLLSLSGISFDRIAQLAEPWHPENDFPPISRKDIAVLSSWETLALGDVEKCPYGGKKGRIEALWRTHLADAPGLRASPPQDRWLVECWYDRIGWAVKRPTYEDLRGKGIWQVARLETEYTHVDTKMHSHLMDLLSSGYERKINAGELSSEELEKKAIKRWFKAHDHKRYADVARSIFKASGHRALYVTEKGFIGLAPWNVKIGDVIAVLDGGKTPFLLQDIPTSGRFKLVGETYVHGIMGGEALDMGLQVQIFTLV
ncbi:heterokaryon incompatibility protein-domain-containing protein [Xylariaceae sp. AK1471]|nr:heterokaryon incompatibility protein-domain-containing protein [Xylariaceae sp. AK1471]